jgi:predicted ester cyclase
MSIEKNKELVRQFLVDTNAAVGDVAKIRALYEKYSSPSLVHHDPSRGDTNGEQRIQAAIMAFTSFPDATYSVDDSIAEGDKVANRYTLRGTHKGAFMRIRPTGKQIVVKGANIYRISEGKIVETWDFLDTFGMMAQLGVLPSSSPRK